MFALHLVSRNTREIMLVATSVDYVKLLDHFQDMLLDPPVKSDDGSIRYFHDDMYRDCHLPVSVGPKSKPSEYGGIVFILDKEEYVKTKAAEWEETSGKACID